jgi:hypothetical protein
MLCYASAMPEKDSQDLQIAPSATLLSSIKAHVRISTDELSSSQIADICSFLEDDPLVKTVEKCSKDSYIDIEICQSDGIDIGDIVGDIAFPKLELGIGCVLGGCIGWIGSALFKTARFLTENKDAIGSVSSLTTTASVTVLAGKYLLAKLSDYTEAHKEKFTKIPIYDSQGNAIKWVKRKNEQSK